MFFGRRESDGRAVALSNRAFGAVQQTTPDTLALPLLADAEATELRAVVVRGFESDAADDFVVHRGDVHPMLPNPLRDFVLGRGWNTEVGRNRTHVLWSDIRH